MFEASYYIERQHLLDEILPKFDSRLLFATQNRFDWAPFLALFKKTKYWFLYTWATRGFVRRITFFRFSKKKQPFGVGIGALLDARKKNSEKEKWREHLCGIMCVCYRSVAGGRHRNGMYPGEVCGMYAWKCNTDYSILLFLFRFRVLSCSYCEGSSVWEAGHCRGRAKYNNKMKKYKNVFEDSGNRSVQVEVLALYLVDPKRPCWERQS